MEKILVTGAAGFIGFHTAQKLLQQGHEVLGLDNLNTYYDVELKKRRLEQLESSPSFSFHKINLEDAESMKKLFADHRFSRVIHLAAQAGVRYSIDHPQTYIDSNITGTLNILEGCRHQEVGHLVYASSSSVYGANTSIPFSEHHHLAHPISLYAATKKSNELMAHTYSHLFGLPTTGLRFFTVYGPWGRPDMALFKFTRSILGNQPIEVFNHGNMSRDFTYIDDIVEGVVRISEQPAKPSESWDSSNPDPAYSSAPYRVYNIGNNQPVELMHFIETLEQELGKKAEKKFLDMQPGDVPQTYANANELFDAVGFKPATTVETGIKNFVRWYLEYYA